eukprot:scaffold109_cov252-Pinguiococcus_pyrenoidosus.AAC.63
MPLWGLEIHAVHGGAPLAAAARAANREGSIWKFRAGEFAHSPPRFRPSPRRPLAHATKPRELTCAAIGRTTYRNQLKSSSALFHPPNAAAGAVERRALEPHGDLRRILPP